MRTIRKAGVFQEPRKAFCKYLKPGRFFMFLGWSDALFEKGLRLPQHQSDIAFLLQVGVMPCLKRD